MIRVCWEALLLVVLGVAGVMWVAVGQGPPLPPEPWEPVPGKPGPGQDVEFEAPFVSGITAFLAGPIRDCLTGEILSPGAAFAEFVFEVGKNPPFEPEDLIMVIVSAEGYSPAAVTEFTQLRVSLLLVQLVYVVPVQTGICLMPLKKEPCEHCTFAFELVKVRKEEGKPLEVLVKIEHCNGGKWEAIQTSWMEALPKPPEGPCTPCTYRLQREQLTFRKPDGKIYRQVRNTIYHCQEDRTFKAVWTDLRTMADKVPEGKCTQGERVIVQTARLEDGKVVIKETIYVCNSRGVWAAMGSRELK